MTNERQLSIKCQECNARDVIDNENLLGENVNKLSYFETVLIQRNNI